MKALLAATIVLLAGASGAAAAGLGTPALSPPLSVGRFFDPDRLLTSGGMRYEAAEEVTLEPELGVGYRTLEREAPGMIEEESHLLHALAGWRLSLADTLFISAAAKLGVLTVESAGRSTGQSLGTRYGYDFARLFSKSPTWTGEVGVHLSPNTDLSLYYDQSPVTGWWSGRQQEERVGTRIIWRFR